VIRRPSATTLAGELDQTRWDYAPETDRRFLLHPAGETFANLPWEARAHHLGPSPLQLRFNAAQASDDALEISDRRHEPG
jgi:hypothetical protein